MKKLSLIAMFLGLGLFAVGCETTTDDAVEEQTEAAGEHAEADAAVEMGSDEAGEEIEDANEAAEDAAETNADAIEDGNAPAPTPVTPE